MSYADFRNSRLGRELTPILSDPHVISEMESLSRRGRPAVEAIGRKVAELSPGPDNTTKQHVGRLVRDTLAQRGWRPVRKGRVAAGNLFSWGAVYGRVQSVELEELSGAERMERAREIIRRAGIDLGTVDEFLAERRSMWGED